MRDIFSIDSRFMQVLSRLADLMILNILFLLTCIPMITIGPATTALYTICFRFGTKREGSLLRGYFRAFRDNFIQGTVLWVIYAVLGGAFYTNLVLFTEHRLLFFISAFLLTLVVMMSAYAFPVLSQFQNTIRGTIKTALAFCVAFFSKTLVVCVVNAVPWVILRYNPYMFMQLGYLWLLLYFSAAGYINSLLLRKSFAHFTNHDEEEL